MPPIPPIPRTRCRAPPRPPPRSSKLKPSASKALEVPKNCRIGKEVPGEVQGEGEDTSETCLHLIGRILTPLKPFEMKTLQLSVTPSPSAPPSPLLSTLSTPFNPFISPHARHPYLGESMPSNPHPLLIQSASRPAPSLFHHSCPALP